MRQSITIFVLIILCCFCSCTQSRAGKWKSNDIPITDTNDQKAKDGFGAAIIVVKDPKSFVEMWNKPDFPDFDTVHDVQRSDQIGAFIMFAGCKPGTNNKCDVRVDYSLINPDGKAIGDSLDQVVWNDDPPPPSNTHISKASMVLEFKDSNKPGEYKVRAVVRDTNAAITLRLETQFQLK